MRVCNSNYSLLEFYPWICKILQASHPSAFINFSPRVYQIQHVYNFIVLININNWNEQLKERLLHEGKDLPPTYFTLLLSLDYIQVSNYKLEIKNYQFLSFSSLAHISEICNFTHILLFVIVDRTPHKPCSIDYRW